MGKFRGGKAIFCQPPLPFKCGGAPQKIMYLSEETFRKNKVRDNTDITWYTAMPTMFPPSPVYAEALEPLARSKGIDLNYKMNLCKIDKDNRVAHFKDNETGDISEVDFDLLHFTPPQTAPKFIRESPLSGEHGWLDVNMQTLQHNKYANVFGLGDVCMLPAAK